MSSPPSVAPALSSPVDAGGSPSVSLVSPAPVEPVEPIGSGPSSSRHSISSTRNRSPVTAVCETSAIA
ncbi:MAG: hypothetical protein H6713_33595 [Myxococcales bacterium]|nr:hypothetical protein [Myxococcales bacterium]